MITMIEMSSERLVRHAAGSVSSTAPSVRRAKAARSGQASSSLLSYLPGVSFSLKML